MTTKIIKEIIIMLLTCLAGLLLFAVIFYEYIPSRKVVPEIAQYSASDNIKELIADDIDKRDEKISGIPKNREARTFWVRALRCGWAANYFSTLPRSIIVAAGLNFSVRNGKRCAPAP